MKILTTSTEAAPRPYRSRARPRSSITSDAVQKIAISIVNEQFSFNLFKFWLADASPDAHSGQQMQRYGENTTRRDKSALVRGKRSDA